jgi:plasmid stabilization system protein ParE
MAFLALDSEQGAERVLRRIERRAAILESSPARGRVVPELASFQMRTWQELVIKPYRLVYRIEGDTVIVFAVFDARRDLEDLLLERLPRSP